MNNIYKDINPILMFGGLSLNILRGLFNISHSLFSSAYIILAEDLENAYSDICIITK